MQVQPADGNDGVSPSFREAAAFWLQLGFVSFGGPAGQIAIMHREVVERRRWLAEREFTDALNFCMLLPGPEALQLAIYLGWRLHGTRGGLVAGLGFIVPAIAIMLVLSFVYVSYGGLPSVQGLLLGLKSAVVAIVLVAVWRIGRRALGRPLYLLLAVGAFLGMEVLDVPFPVIILAAAAAGAVFAPGRATAEPPRPGRTARRGHAWRVLAAGIALWAVPWLLTGSTLGFGSLWARSYVFFTQAALVTFGGAYAVLGYVTRHLVENLGWVTAAQSVAGLALAETTPGPLVIVLQFMGFMAGWNQPAPLGAPVSAFLAALLSCWATFLPSFVFIFVGAPYVDRIAREPRLAGALAAVTAAVVGIIATLALMIARLVLLPQRDAVGVDPVALAIAAGVLLLLRSPLGLPWILALAAGAGLACQLLGLA
jgi:chromate transporter